MFLATRSDLSVLKSGKRKLVTSSVTNWSYRCERCSAIPVMMRSTPPLGRVSLSCGEVFMSCLELYEEYLST